MDRLVKDRLGAARVALDGKSGEVQEKISAAQVDDLRDVVARDPGPILDVKHYLQIFCSSMSCANV